MIRGYNAPFFFNQFRSTNYYCPDGVLRKVQALRPGIIRFPGGTLANTYDVNKPGYGESISSATENYIHRMTDFVTRMNNVPVVFVAGVYQALMNPTNANYWIDGMMKSLELLPTTTHVELGNELIIQGKWTLFGDKPRFFESDSSYVSKVNAKGREFLEMADRFIAPLRKTHPNIRVGIPVMPPYTLRNKEWNSVLRNWKKNDFEIFHLYLNTKSYGTTQAEITKALAGAIKPVCITEWSWQHGDDSSKNLLDVGTAYYQSFFNNFPAICESLNVEMICQHMLYGSNPYCVIKA